MKKVILAALCVAGFSLVAAAQNKEEKIPTAEESATTEAERLEKVLKLEDWQVFYVDSTLRHDFVEMEAELKAMQEARVSNVDLYYDVQDRWFQQIEDTLRRYLDDDQWKKFVKNMSRGQKDSWKRREKKRKKEEQNKN